MAPESAEFVFDPFPLEDKLERIPDSSPLAVSSNTQHESGIPPARMRAERALEQSEDRLELALATVSRTEANLGQLLRGLKHLAAGAAAAREANLELVHELDDLRAHLVHVNEEEVALRYRMAQLEQLLDVIRHQTSKERAFLIEQQDLFLVEIMTDYDRQLAELRHSLREAPTRSSHESQIAELTAQRDQAREYATRCERERDLAWQELALGKPPTTAPALESSAGRKSGATAIGSVALKPVSVAAPSSDAARQPTGYSLKAEELSE